MALSTTIDASSPFTAGGSGNFVVDMSGWDYATVQLESPSGAINFLSTNDSSAVTGSTDGNSLTAANFTAVQGKTLSTGAAATNGSASGLWKISDFGRYLQLSGSGITATKILIFLSKVS